MAAPGQVRGPETSPRSHLLSDEGALAQAVPLPQSGERNLEKTQWEPRGQGRDRLRLVLLPSSTKVPPAL